MSIVEALLDSVHAETRAYPGAAVLNVRVRIGALRLVVPDMLRTCFAAATRDTALAGATLEIDEIPARARCRQCQCEFSVEEDFFQCPRCQSADGEVLAGRELDLMSIELEDTQEVAHATH
jgi:hydrogenase nickel incorporation protein HypA/HybF